jgi:AmiR/NasT family two-component response regulator
VIEQAKGILMARNGIDSDRAFELLRDRSQASGQKLADIALAMIDSHLLLTAAPRDATGSTGEPPQPRRR